MNSRWSRFFKSNLLLKLPKYKSKLDIYQVINAATSHMEKPNEEFRDKILETNNNTDIIQLAALNLIRQNDPKLHVAGFRLLEVGGELGNLDSQLALANLLKKGLGPIQPDLTRSSRIMQGLVRLEYGRTHVQLANDYLAKKQHHLAYKHAQVAANHGEIGGELLLGVLYVQGLGVKKDLAKSMEYLERVYRADKYESTIAARWLGDTYYYGFPGFDKDWDRAFEMYNYAAEHGEPSAQYMLGFVYFKGHGTKMNIDFALEYWKMAAEQNQPDALYQLGILCVRGYKENGADIPQDVFLAKTFLQKLLNNYQHNSQYSKIVKSARTELNKLDSIQTIQIKTKKKNAIM